MPGVPFIEEGDRLFTAPALGRPALVLKFGGKSLHSFVHLLQLLFIKLCEPSDVVGSTERTRSPPAAVDQCLNRRSGGAASAHERLDSIRPSMASMAKCVSTMPSQSVPQRVASAAHHSRSSPSGGRCSWLASPWRH